MMNVPDELIKTPPMWLTPDTFISPETVAFGPFVLERKGDKVVGMYLKDYEKHFAIYDGIRVRYFLYDRAETEDGKVTLYNDDLKMTLRSIEKQDAPLFGYKANRAGITKEQLINEALQAFQLNRI